MRNICETRFSLVIPTRERADLLKQCLVSFFESAERPNLVEAIVICDLDDRSMWTFGDFIRSTSYDVKVLFRQRSERFIRDYHNFGAQCSVGRYIWILNDECEVVTEHWDTVVECEVERFLKTRPDRIAYVSVDDSTHSSIGKLEEWGTCFPILSRETIDVLNGIMPAEIDMWCGDIVLYDLFRRLEPSRIVNAAGVVKVLHHSPHNGPRVEDATQRNVARISKQTKLNQEEMGRYLGALTTLISRNQSFGRTRRLYRAVCRLIRRT